jgi:PHS family inorganic phosphate transporter-like MFS transporter
LYLLLTTTFSFPLHSSTGCQPPGIFTPNILNNIFGKGETLIDLCWQSLAVSAVGLPGAVAAIVLLERLGSKKENLYGFLLIAACFAAMAVVYTAAPDQHWLLFFLFCCLTFALNFGPNVATFVLPATAFPVHVRSTFHGLSAGSGKVGAVVGTFMYQPLADAYGSATVMWVQCVLCVCGALISHYFIADDAEKHGGSGGGLGGRNVLGGGGGGGAVGQLNEALLEGGAREERGRGGH